MECPGGWLAVMKKRSSILSALSGKPPSCVRGAILLQHRSYRLDLDHFPGVPSEQCILSIMKNKLIIIN